MMLKSAVLLSLLAVAISFPALDETVKDEPSSRVVGGNNAVNGQFPYVASIRNTNNVHFSHGALITNRWVVSIAWNMVGRTTFNTRVAFGSVVRTGGFIYFLSRVVVHPGYNSVTRANDISLLETNSNVFLDNTIWPANLPIFSIIGGEVQAVGWGNLNAGANAPQANILQFVTLQVVNDQTCRNFFANDPNFPLANGICAVSNANMRGMCAGDEGGPMVIGNTLHGLHRISPWCGQGTNPDVFLSIMFYRSWIGSIINGTSMVVVE